MPTYIAQGHYSREAIRGMLLKPEDREPAIAKLFEMVGGRLLAWYFTVASARSLAGRALSMRDDAFGKLNGRRPHGRHAAFVPEDT